jgi:class 3 adenylate cyclase
VNLLDQQHPRLEGYARTFADLRWAALICDEEWRLVWVSDELREFLRASDQSDLGIGAHIAEALLRDTWLSALAPESLELLFRDVGPYLLDDFARRGRAIDEVVPADMAGLLEGLKPAPAPDIFKTRFLAKDPADPELPPYPVNCAGLRVRGEAGELGGIAVIMFMDVRPNLVALLARGAEEMYERMARLVDPRARQAAILFCDLQSSGRLSRQLPSISYFRLMRELWTGIDQAVADNTGIVGKHAGDGAVAFFLVDDLDTPSRASAAAVRTAARIHEISDEILSGVLEGDSPMRVGVHWDGSLYMGQLVPGSRLDVTALGDAVNETARIQEVAEAGETIASKQLLEQLTPDDAADVGIDLEKISYRLLQEVAPEAEKVVRDAGSIPVTKL